MGHSSANAMARLGAFFAPFVVDDLSLRQIGVIMLVIHLFTVLCVTRLPETAGRAMGAVDDDESLEHDSARAALTTDSVSLNTNSVDEPDGLLREDGPVSSSEEGILT